MRETRLYYSFVLHAEDPEYSHTNRPRRSRAKKCFICGVGPTSYESCLKQLTPSSKLGSRTRAHCGDGTTDKRLMTDLADRLKAALAQVEQTVRGEIRMRYNIKQSALSPR